MAHSYNFSSDDFLGCCGSSKFAVEMTKFGPFPSLLQAVDASRSIWWNKVDIPGWLEAFTAHPRIGDVMSLKKDAPTAEWSKGEQSLVLKSANESTMQELAEWNQKYEAKFGFTFLICASGKGSSEVLDSLKARFSNRPIDELQIAADEQQKITKLRLGKLFAERGTSATVQVAAAELSSSNNSDLQYSSGSLNADRRVGHIGAHFNSMRIEKQPDSSPQLVSSQLTPTHPPITTHVLDVSRGRPGAGIDVVLEFWKGFLKGDESGEWVNIGSSVTNSDGRSGALMPPSNSVNAGRYKLTFNTEKYFLELSNSNVKSVISGFYPYVSVVFDIKPSQVFEHFHVPVLLSPFSYTTYRGS